MGIGMKNVSRASALLALLLATGCAVAPGGGPATHRPPGGVGDMLSGVRARDRTSTVGFDGDSVRPGRNAEHDALAAATSFGGQVEVTGHRDGMDGNTPLLGERRALVIASAIQGAGMKATVRFDVAVPAGEVRISPDGPAGSK